MAIWKAKMNTWHVKFRKVHFGTDQASGNKIFGIRCDFSITNWKLKWGSLFYEVLTRNVLNVTFFILRAMYRQNGGLPQVEIFPFLLLSRQLFWQQNYVFEQFRELQKDKFFPCKWKRQKHTSCLYLTFSLLKFSKYFTPDYCRLQPNLYNN